ncbi:hypothetical protein ILYODFUR_022415 [Ilyodon furcidens]|uniref:Uncharacterized protein n=1 Tax=Ilyodon furcidens TaxID=33524 RepID=A0ABV0SQ68_9TELE
MEINKQMFMKEATYKGCVQKPSHTTIKRSKSIVKYPDIRTTLLAAVARHLGGWSIQEKVQGCVFVPPHTCTKVTSGCYWAFVSYIVSYFLLVFKTFAKMCLI